MNPTLKTFLEENKDVTLIGLGWAIYWRFFVAYFLVVFLLAGFFSLIG